MKIAGFTARGERVVATADWVPANARIDPDSWRIEADGSLTVGFTDLTPCWDGVLTSTDNGYALFFTEKGIDVAEHELQLFALDDGGQACGEPLPFTPRRVAPVFDPALASLAEDLAIAAQGVLDAWEGGDLADAVRGLAHSLAELRALLPERAQTAPSPQDGAAGDIA
jgi:hypothetical protein